MSNLLLIRGLPGSGKSTLAQTYTKLGWVWTEADHYRETPSEHRFYSTSTNRFVHILCQTHTRAALEQGYDVVVANTFIRRKEIRPYADMAAELGADLSVMTCKGEYTSIHDVPQVWIDNMRAQWQEWPGE